MKINLQTGLSSHSAAAKTPAKLVAFIQAVFNLKAPVATKIADSIVHISKEKALVTPAIDAFLDFAKTAKQPEIDKAIKSKTVQNLKPVLAAIVKNKTFAGTIAAIKKFKFKAPSVKAPVSSTEGKRVDRETYESKYKIPLGLTVLPEKEFFRGSAAGFVVGVSRNQLVELFDQPYKGPDGDEWRIGYKRQPFALYSSDFKAPTDPDAPHVFSIRSKDTELYRYGTPKLAMILVENGLGMGTFARDVSEATKALKALNVKVKVGRSREDDDLAKMDNEKNLSSYANLTRYIIDSEVDGDYTDAVNKALGINSKEAGIGDDGAEEGLFAKNVKSNVMVNLLDPKSAANIIKKLGQKVKANSYVVYTDSLEDEGPFLGTPVPVPGTLVVLPWKAALAEFVRQVTLPAPIQKPTTAAKSLPYKSIQKLAEALFDVNDADDEVGVKARTKWFNSKYGTNFKSIIIEHLEADDVTVIDFITKSNVRTRVFSVFYAKRLARSLGLSGTQNDIGLVTIVRNKPVKNTARVNPLFASAMREVMIMS